MPDQPLHHEQSPQDERAVVLPHLVVGGDGPIEALLIGVGGSWSRPVRRHTPFVGSES